MAFGSEKKTTSWIPFRGSGINIDNSIFRLHYKATVWIMLVFVVLLTDQHYLGEPFRCTSKEGIQSDVLDSLCRAYPTFTLPDVWHKKIGEEVPYPGIDKYTEDENRMYHTYYHWVRFILFLQSIMFSIPMYVWRTLEGGKIAELTMPLRSIGLACDDNKIFKHVVDYLTSRRSTHNTYFTFYVFSEVMNFINVVGQIYLTNAFLGGGFSTYGSEVVQFSGWSSSIQYNPMAKNFPRVTQCIFYRFTPSGDVQRHEALCVLAMNSMHDKIYLFLWFWFVILAVLSGLVLVYRFLLILIPKLHFSVIRWRSQFVQSHCLKILLDKYQLGDRFILDLLSKNLDPVQFGHLVKQLSIKITDKSNPSGLDTECKLLEANDKFDVSC